MDRALSLLQKFVVDAQNGRILKDKLCFGAPWRHPPSSDDPTLCHQWAKIQLMDFVQCLVNAEFGVSFHLVPVFKFFFLVPVFKLISWSSSCYCLYTSITLNMQFEELHFFPYVHFL